MLPGLLAGGACPVNPVRHRRDYPHQAATWPHSQEVLARDFQGIPEADLRKIVRENTAKLYGFALNQDA